MVQLWPFSMPQCRRTSARRCGVGEEIVGHRGDEVAVFDDGLLAVRLRRLADAPDLSGVSHVGDGTALDVEDEELARHRLAVATLLGAQPGFSQRAAAATALSFGWLSLSQKR